MANPLHNYKILVADADQQLATVLKNMLGKMGFPHVQGTRSGQEALERLERQSVDFLITEWNTQDLDGISLIKQIRHHAPPPNPTLPVIMLTGRAEESDVATARDSGINEYVVKPFSAKTVFERLERIIEKPRNFVLSKSFVGPDRRHNAAPLPRMENRRVLHIALQPPPKVIRGKLLSSLPDTPSIWTPDFSLKQKLSPAKSLAGLISPKVLDVAQASIDAIAVESLHWIKENMAELKILLEAMKRGKAPASVAGDLSEVSLAIHSRAGTFGYNLASKVAYMLYLFCRNFLEPTNPGHQTAVQKHIEVLHVILSSDPELISAKQSEQILMELHNLAIKYAS